MPDMYGCLGYARVFQTSVDTYGDALGCLEHLKCLCLDNEASPWSMEAREWSKFRWGYLNWMR